MESRGWTREALEPYIGGRGRVSEVLNRKRPLTITMIRNLAQATGIPASILIQPYQTEQEPVDADFVNEPTKQTVMRSPVAAD